MVHRFSTGILILVLLTGLLSFLPREKEKKGYWAKQTPPGTVKIKDNFYCDKTEIGNLHWREYTYWVKRVFGDTSAEFLACKPDTTVWVKTDTCLSKYADYLSLVKYDFYPVVGISQKQAADFVKSRGDRVFERLLIMQHVLSENPNQNAQSYFSAENYFTGKYLNKTPDPNYLYYPVYRLATVDEYRMLVRLNDSLDKKKGLLIQAGIVPCVNDTVKREPMISIYTSKKPFPLALVNLQGNVSEWAAEEGISLGGGWANTKEQIAKQDTFHTAGVNAWTGFRNVCEWKKYEGAIK